MEDTLTVNGQRYRIIRLLGHGKGGYSYLATADEKPVVIKQIHHEPCDYYVFADKFASECRDYQRLLQAGIRIPQMIAADSARERIVKEYIEGETVFDLIRRNISTDAYLNQVRDMAKLAEAAGLNIDYFPTNFVINNDRLWYVDYECNSYLEEWSFENWGRKYWSRTAEFEEYLRNLSEKDEL